MYLLDIILVIILEYLDENLSYNCHFRWCVCEEVRVLYLGQWGVGCAAGSWDIQSAGVPRDGQRGRSHDRSSSNVQQSQSSHRVKFIVKQRVKFIVKHTESKFIIKHRDKVIKTCNRVKLIIKSSSNTPNSSSNTQQSQS